MQEPQGEQSGWEELHSETADPGGGWGGWGGGGGGEE